MGPEEFEIGTDHIAPLGDDNIPDVNQSHFCHSCATPFTGVYCTSCGQKNDDYRRSLFSLIKEFLGSITAIESRIWRTWAALLFKPGKVAREYANGRRMHWSSPVRVYIAMSILLFGFLSLSQMQLISIDIDARPIEGVTKPLEDLTADDVQLIPAAHFFETKNRINARNKSRNFELIALKLEADQGLKVDIGSDAFKQDFDNRLDNALEDGSVAPEDAAQAQEILDRIDAAITPQKEELSTTEEDVGGEKVLTFSNIDGKVYELESWSDILFTIIQDPAKINGAFFKYLPRIMFIMMPFTMLIGALFIRGRGNALLYDHLVHAAYIHAVAFFLLLLGIILGLILPGSPAPIILMIALLVYLPMSLKRMFERSWLKTIWTAYGVGFIYAFNMLLIMTGLLGMQILATVTEMGTPLSP